MELAYEGRADVEPTGAGWGVSLRADKNRTITLTDGEVQELRRGLLRLQGPASLAEVEGQILWQDMLDAVPWLPDESVDLLFLDAPYNLTKAFGTTTFRERSPADYAEWIGAWFPPLMRLLRRTASVYICGDWRSSQAICSVAERHLCVRNRITWEREKGRGAAANWKNCSEDIWYCTVSDAYTFNADAVKLRRRVLAPYTDSDGNPKDWVRSGGAAYRLTHPSNLWTDITVPFWSMPENTEHPTQKPEKLLAKILLASTNPGDVVLDPFAGSGTTCVVASKLGRRFVGIERDLTYCCLARKRLILAQADRRIQGYEDGVFWERNAINHASRRDRDQRGRGRRPAEPELALE